MSWLRLLVVALPFLIGSCCRLVWGQGSEQTSVSQAEELERKRREKAEHLKPDEVSLWERRMRNWEKARMPARIFQKGFRGLRPLVGGMPAGSGFVVGGGYIRGLTSEAMSFQANARYSTKGYNQYDALFEFPTRQAERPVQGRVSALYHDYSRLNFFGLGTNSQKDDQAYFRAIGYSVLGGVTAKLGRLHLDGDAGRMQIDAREGKSEPSLDRVFEGIPGFGDGRTDFNVYGGSVELDLRNHWESPAVGADISLQGWRYDDQTFHTYDSTKVVLLARALIPLGHNNRRLAFRFRSAHLQAEHGGVEPFYLQETIGGANSLRGWQEMRFRDSRNLLMNFEYRWEVWHYADFAFFADTGKVFSDYSDFDLKHLKWGYGWGIRVRTQDIASLNIDFAFSEEGFVIHIGSGPRF